jgi:hypothetical protein
MRCGIPDAAMIRPALPCGPLAQGARVEVERHEWTGLDGSPRSAIVVIPDRRCTRAELEAILDEQERMR